MNYQSRPVLFFLLLLGAAGFSLPFWPLSLVSILLLGFFNRPVYCIALGLLLDLAWGAPQGTLGAVLFPLTIVGCFAVLLRMLADRYFFPKTPPTVY